MKRFLFCVAAAVLSLCAMAQQQAPAFPGAEGHGRYVTGGRGKTVVHVTNLNDSGTGSFRAAVTGGSNRIIVFDVGGVIPLTKDISFKDNITILGQTAPYPGITLRYYTVQPGNNNIIRFIRFRRGQEKDINDGADACWQRQKTGIIFDHCSFSWSIDEVASFYDNNNFTMQWCTIGESLVDAGHGKGAHGYGGIWGGKLASFHHNMILHVANRSPRFNGARYNWTGYTNNKLYSEYNWQNAVQAENVDFRNCVIYNANGCYGGPGGGQINMVGNYYKSGPAATIDRLTTVSIGNSGNASGHSEYWTMTSRYYLEGNLIDGAAAEWSKMKYDSDVPTYNGQRYTNDPNHYYGSDLTYTKVNGTDCLPIKLDSPAPAGEVTTHAAAMAFEKIQLYCGASLHRDEVDARYMTEAKNKTATYTGSVTKKKGLIDVVADCNGYTEANFPTGERSASEYTVKDGIPDAWAKANGLDPTKNNASGYDLDPLGYYTNIEVYANSLVQDIMLAENKDAESTFKEYYPKYVKEDGTVVKAINDPNVPSPGNIAWVYNGGTIEQTPVITDLDGDFTTSVTAGSNLKISPTPTFTINTTNITMTSFTFNAKETEAADDNAVRFSITPPAGKAFTPTNVAFKTTHKYSRVGGHFSAYWQNSDGSIIPVSGDTQAEYYSNSAGSRYNSVDVNLDAPASDGTCSLVINLYNTTYHMGLGDIVVSGLLSNAVEVLKGDVNGDGTVDVADVVAIVNYILEKPSENFNKQAADVNGDGNIDVGDVVSVVNIILTSN
jgi:hypothetical protein